MAKDSRLAKDLNQVREQLLRISALSGTLARHLPDAQSIAWDGHPEANAEQTPNPDEEPGDVGKAPPKSTRAREALRALKDRQTGIPAVEDSLIRKTGDVLKLFSGPGADTELRGTLLGWNDSKTGEWLPHTPSLELGQRLAAQRRREKRAPRTGETAHERLEAQPRAPKAPGEDPNLRRPA